MREGYPGDESESHGTNREMLWGEKDKMFEKVKNKANDVMKSRTVLLELL